MGDYQTAINSILTNQRQLMSGVNNVYPGFSLNNLVSQAQRDERARIAGITNALRDSVIQKHLNLAQLYGDKYDVLSTNIKLMSDNKDMFLNNFNENTEKIDQLNNVISTKNKIIQINYYEQTKKDRIIFIMTKIILYLFLMIIPVILVAMNYLSVLFGIIFIIVCAIITVVVVFFQMKKNEDIDAINVMNKTKETAKDFARTVVRNIFPKSFIKSCPSKENPSRTVSFNYESGNEVSLDNSQNVWEEGDIPTIGATKQGYLALGEEAEPMPYYGGDPTTPTYKCEWTGDPAKRTDMNNKNIQFQTTIPCEYYPGYKTVT
jgi:heme/copper-type cytochrome/quinol oxidase subunit 4